MGNSSPGSAPRQTTRLRWLVAVAAPLVAVPVLSACGADFDAQTNIPYQAAEGSNDRSSGVYALNALVVSDGDGNGTVVAALINQAAADDGLISVTATDLKGQALTASTLADPVPLPAKPSADQSVQLATDGEVRVAGDTVEAGNFITLTFTFEDAAPVELDVPVVAAGRIYADVPVGPIATESEDTATPSDDSTAPPA